ncbi:MAG: hypothetical protein J5825_00110 [Lachnospiraceae bacterium]|nr:hypothetical protein [Lachnospiraceae bacterium]
MDVKAKVEEIVKKIQADPNLLKEFQSDPVKVVEKLAGVDIPDGVEDQLVAGVKNALAGNKVGNVVDSAVDAVKGLFGGNKEE